MRWPLSIRAFAHRLLLDQVTGIPPLVQHPKDRDRLRFHAVVDDVIFDHQSPDVGGKLRQGLSEQRKPCEPFHRGDELLSVVVTPLLSPCPARVPLDRPEIVPARPGKLQATG